MIKIGKGEDGEDELSALIRDQLHDPANRKHLSRMPAFRVDSNTNEIFSDLLKRLDRAERAATPR
jgi:hypothetical protein